MFEGGKPETSNDILTELARLGETRSWEPGTTVVTEGDAADCMHLIHEGELTLAAKRAPPADMSPREPAWDEQHCVPAGSRAGRPSRPPRPHPEALVVELHAALEAVCEDNGCWNKSIAMLKRARGDRRDTSPPRVPHAKKNSPGA